jgi:hypothetical protein
VIDVTFKVGEIAMNEIRRQTENLSSLLLSGAVITFLTMLTCPGNAETQTVIDLTYDSAMDMVRPEVHPGIVVHHNLQVTLSDRNKVSETRDRSTHKFSDNNGMKQVLGSSGDAGNYASWHVVGKDQLIRVEHDPQSTRTMTVTLTSPTTCRLEVTDALRSGFSEYAFLRISTHSLGYFSTYRVTGTSCTIH